MGSAGRAAFEFMKTVRQGVENLRIPHNSPVSPWVTISAGGVTCVPKAGDRYETFLKLADTMLYDAKRLGRNQVVWMGETGAQWRERN